MLRQAVEKSMYRAKLSNFEVQEAGLFSDRFGYLSVAVPAMAYVWS